MQADVHGLSPRAEGSLYVSQALCGRGAVTAFLKPVVLGGQAQETPLLLLMGR